MLTVCLREISLTEIYFDLKEANRFMDNIILCSLIYISAIRTDRNNKKTKFIRRRMNRTKWSQPKNPICWSKCVCLRQCILLLILITVWLMSFWNDSHFFSGIRCPIISIFLFKRVNCGIEVIFISQSVECTQRENII